MSSGLFKLHERVEGRDMQISDALPLDDFVRFLDAIGPQTIPRVTKSEAAFLKQLVKKDKSP